MTAINATIARKMLYQLITEVNESSSPVTITNAKGKNAVLVSEEDWNAIQETLYLVSMPGMVASLQKAHQEPLADCAVYDEAEEW